MRNGAGLRSLSPPWAGLHAGPRRPTAAIGPAEIDGIPADAGPAAFHRELGAEHWRQYPPSATNCADALGLVDHWRCSHDPARRAQCAQLFKKQCASRAQPDATPDQLVVLA